MVGVDGDSRAMFRKRGRRERGGESMYAVRTKVLVLAAKRPKEGNTMGSFCHLQEIVRDTSALQHSRYWC